MNIPSEVKELFEITEFTEDKLRFGHPYGDVDFSKLTVKKADALIAKGFPHIKRKDPKDLSEKPPKPPKPA